jgi:hypothetical protein
MKKRSTVLWKQRGRECIYFVCCYQEWNALQLLIVIGTIFRERCWSKPGMCFFFTFVKSCNFWYVKMCWRLVSHNRNSRKHYPISFYSFPVHRSRHLPFSPWRALPLPHPSKEHVAQTTRHEPHGHPAPLPACLCGLAWPGNRTCPCLISFTLPPPVYFFPQITFAKIGCELWSRENQPAVTVYVGSKPGLIYWYAKCYRQTAKQGSISP